jgi:phosphoglycolate phosphatase-like HAD superfamily hydrolase
LANLLTLFDLDGTLVDTAGAGKRAIERACHRLFGLDGISRISSGIRFAGMTDASIFKALVSAAGITALRYAALKAELCSCYLQALSVEMERPDPRRRIMPGVIPLLDELSARPDVSLGLLTGNLEAGARIKLEPFGLNEYFPGGGFGSDHHDRRQVARLAWLKLRNVTGIPFTRSRVAVLGDTEQDVSCAKANGFLAIAVESGWATRRALEACAPDALLPDLADLGRILSVLGLPAVRG